MVCRGEPFQSTWAPTTKFEPFTVSVKAPEACCAWLGMRELMEGIGSGSLGPTTVVGLPAAMVNVAMASPIKLIGVVEVQGVLVVALQPPGLLFDVAKSIRLSFALRFEVLMVNVRAVAGRGTPATTCGCCTTLVRILSRHVSYARAFVEEPQLETVDESPFPDVPRMPKLRNSKLS